MWFWRFHQAAECGLSISGIGSRFRSDLNHTLAVPDPCPHHTSDGKPGFVLANEGFWQQLTLRASFSALHSDDCPLAIEATLIGEPQSDQAFLHIFMDEVFAPDASFLLFFA